MSRLNTGETLIGGFIVVLFWAFWAALGAVGLEYTVEFWSAYNGKFADFPYRVAFLICLIPYFCELSISLGIATFILSFVV